MHKTGGSEIHAVLYKILEKISTPTDEVCTLVKGIYEGKLQVSNTPEGHWLGEFGSWLTENKLKVSS